MRRRLEPFVPLSDRGRIANRLRTVGTGSGVEVATSSGRVRGRRQPGMLSFTGVPYALPPTGSRRFQPPEPHTGWTGVHDTTTVGPEPPVPFELELFPHGLRRAGWSEDCLHLNVHTPAADDRRRPVLVWIHGGAFVDGSNSRVPFDPAAMVTCDDVVVVSINYRLGALGWLYLGHLSNRFADSGNHGLLDQIAALRWVNDNIARFGGDPDNVCLFGTSAGAMSITSLLAIPAASGLFHRAICQSGAGSFPLTTDTAARLADRFLSLLRVRTTDELMDVMPERLMFVQQQAINDLSDELDAPHQIDLNLLLGPVIDGRTLTQSPHDAIAEGSAADVPLIVGTNADECSLLAFHMPPSKRKLSIALHRWFGDRATEVREVYRQVVGDDEDAIYEAVLTDHLYRIPALRLAEAHRHGATAPGYHYLFTWRSPGRFFRSAHGLELPVVFDVQDAATLSVSGFASFGAPPVELRQAMRAAWTSMARSGDPNHSGLPTWAPFTGDRETMLFDVPCQPVRAPEAARLTAWDGLLR